MRKALLLFGICSLVVTESAVAQVFTQPKPQTQPRPPKKPRPRPPSSTSSRPIATPLPTRISNFSDPVPYCAVNRVADIPGPTYVGQPVPAWVSAASAPATPANGGTLAYNWRCMNGRVMACVSTAELSGCSKPSQDRTVTPEMLQHCKGKRKGEIPQSVVGNSVPIWSCRSGAPEISGYRAGLDPQGFFANQWHDVTDYSPQNMMSGIPRTFTGRWRISTKSSGLLSFVYDIKVVLTGARTGSQVGQADYFQLNSYNGQAVHLCSTRLMRAGSNVRVLELEEQYTLRTTNIACPVQGRLAIQQKDGRLWLEWRRLRDGKVTLSGWGEAI